MNSGEQEPHESLNPYQANRLRITCQYIDKLLGEIEGILNATVSKAAFPRYVTDIASRAAQNDRRLHREGPGAIGASPGWARNRAREALDSGLPSRSRQPRCD